MPNEPIKKGKVLSILQEKGGCGKSCAIFNIASYFSRAGKVLIIDLDGQAADITYYMFGNKVGESTDNMRSDIMTIVDVFRRHINIDDVIMPYNESIHVIPANIQVTYLNEGDKITFFKKCINHLREIYDYILIDVPPSPNRSHVLCLSVCDFVIPIVNPDSASPKALISLNESIEEIRETSNSGVEYLGIVMNKYDGRTNLAKEMLNQIELLSDKFGTCMFRTMIHQGIALSEHILMHQSIFEYAPKSKAAIEYEALAQEILERIIDMEQEEIGL